MTLMMFRTLNHRLSDDPDNYTHHRQDGHHQITITITIVIITWAGSPLRWLAISSYSLSTPLSKRSDNHHSDHHGCDDDTILHRLLCEIPLACIVHWMMDYWWPRDKMQGSKAVH